MTIFAGSSHGPLPDREAGASGVWSGAPRRAHPQSTHHGRQLHSALQRWGSRDRDKNKDRHIDRDRDRNKDRDRDRNKDRYRDINKGRDRDRNKGRDRDRNKDR